jgi:hypothetical protein
MVSELYLRIRDTLVEATSRRGGLSPQTVEDLAVTIYMVTVAEAHAGPSLLADLKRTLAGAIESEPMEFCG